MLLKKSSPKWVREYPVTLDRKALQYLFDKYGSKVFEQEVVMTFVLYDVKKDPQANAITEKLKQLGWDVESFPQSETSDKLVIDAKSSAYRLNEENYKKDTLMFRRLAEMYQAGYDGWYITQSSYSHPKTKRVPSPCS